MLLFNHFNSSLDSLSAETCADRKLRPNRTSNFLNKEDLTVSEERSTGKTGLVHSTDKQVTKYLLSHPLCSSYQP